MRDISKHTHLVSMFPLVVRHVAATAKYFDADEQAMARVAILVSEQSKRGLVLMIDGDFAASVTSAANELVTFINEFHLAPLEVDKSNSFWLYRDRDGNWDEISPESGPGFEIGAVSFRPLGQRSEEDALFYIASENFVPRPEDMIKLVKFLRLGSHV